MKKGKNGEIALLFTGDILLEYIEVLLRHGIAPDSITLLIQSFQIVGEKVLIKFFHLPQYPSDPDDIIFLLCALNGKGSLLVSDDDHLLSLEKAYPVSICHPRTFLDDLN